MTPLLCACCRSGATRRLTGARSVARGAVVTGDVRRCTLLGAADVAHHVGREEVCHRHHVVTWARCARHPMMISSSGQLLVRLHGSPPGRNAGPRARLVNQEACRPGETGKTCKTGRKGRVKRAKGGGGQAKQAGRTEGREGREQPNSTHVHICLPHPTAEAKRHVGRPGRQGGGGPCDEELWPTSYTRM
jgi:hypothetical protein